MSDLDAAFATLVRNVLEGSERDAGRAPLVPDLKEGTAPPIVSTGDGASSSRLESGSSSSAVELGARGPAMRGEPNDWAWRPQTRAEMLAYRESYSHLGTAAVGATVTIDPNEACNFMLKASGNVTISVGAPDAPPDLDALAPTPQFFLPLTLWIYLPKGAVVTWTGVKFGQDVLDPAGDGSKPSLLATASADGWWTVTLSVFPGIATFGYLAARRA
ncbi:hypothetical protein [Methylobacterium sp. yr596]|uniref:hypothetical protein n=1 Tax=Methylobacterium sp. yr596 TaxID=1761800 RepID=UPI0008E3BA7F|nr:hypothetical protein [Methylobacterium sp. yr596]SFE20259.1 hypothetical protein SAMN04487844_101407 [Methylobacterium sp. yr596]